MLLRPYRTGTQVAAVLVVALSCLAWAACGGDDGGQQSPSPSRNPSVAAATARPSAGPTRSATPDIARFQLTTFVAGADFPVALEFAPDGRLFYNELHTGNIRIVANGRLQAQPFAHLAVLTTSEHGLLGLALDPRFADNHYVYALYSQGDADDNGVRQQIVRWKDVNGSGEDETVIVDNLPISQSVHNGGRIAFGPDGKLYASIGDTTNRDSAQDTAALSGKILRYNADGSVPEGNPFPGSPVWAWGVRNTFGLAFGSDGTLWATDNSDTHHDELNRIVKGGNYGWPEVKGIAGDSRFIDPVVESGDDDTWVPTGDLALTIGGPGDDVFFCSAGHDRLLRLPAGANAVTDTGQPCSYDVALGPDAALYLADGDTIYRWGPPG